MKKLIQEITEAITGSVTTTSNTSNYKVTHTVLEAKRAFFIDSALLLFYSPLTCLLRISECIAIISMLIKKGKFKFLWCEVSKALLKGLEIWWRIWWVDTHLTGRTPAQIRTWVKQASVPKERILCCSRRRGIVLLMSTFLLSGCSLFAIYEMTQGGLAISIQTIMKAKIRNFNYFYSVQIRQPGITSLCIGMC